MPRHSRGAARAAQPTSPDAPRIPGGAAGVPTAEANVPRAPVDDHSTADRQRAAQRYMLVDGPRDGGTGKIKYFADGYGVGLTPGNTVTAATHNLARMRSQGIKLEPIPDEVIDEPEPAAMDVPPSPDEEPEGEDGNEDGDE